MTGLLSCVFESVSLFSTAQGSFYTHSQRLTSTAKTWSQKTNVHRWRRMQRWDESAGFSHRSDTCVLFCICDAQVSDLTCSMWFFFGGGGSFFLHCPRVAKTLPLAGLKQQRKKRYWRALWFSQAHPLSRHGKLPSLLCRRYFKCSLLLLN